MTTRIALLGYALAVTLLGVLGFGSKTHAADPPGWPPTVHILASDPQAAEEGSDPAAFTVFRVGPTNETLTVAYAIGGAAENGVDFQTLSGTVTIPPGAYSAPIAVLPIDDFLIEGWEHVVVALDQPPAWPPPYIVSWPSVAVAYVEDNDFAPTNQPPVVALVNPPDGAVFVGVESLSLVARASDRDDKVLRVEFFDGTNSLGIVTNALPLLTVAGAGPVMGRGVVSASDSPVLVEPPELLPEPVGDPIGTLSPLPIQLFRLVWQNPAPGRHVLAAVATDARGESTTSAAVTITVVYQPQTVVTVRATDPEATEPSVAGTRLDTATFTLYRRGPTNYPLTVWYRLSGSASNGADYRDLATSVVIPEGETKAPVLVEPLGDNLLEGDESVMLTVLPPICIQVFPPPPECYVVGRPDAARAVIHDTNVSSNRPPVVTMVRPVDGSVFLAPARILTAAQAYDADGRVVSVEFFEGTNSLGIVSNSLASVTNFHAPATLVWSNVPPGHYVLSAVATDNDGATGRARPVEIRVVPHPVPTIVNIVATDPIASEPGVLTVIDDATIEVSRTGDTGRPLMVFYRAGGTASNGLDYDHLSGHVTIPAGANRTNLAVHANGDLLVEGTETVVLKLEPAPWLTTTDVMPLDWYTIGTNYEARAVIRDNDMPPTNQPPRVALVKPESGDVFAAPADITIWAAADDADGSVRTVEFFAGADSLGVVTNTANGAGGGSAGGNGVMTGAVEQLFRFVWLNAPAGVHVLTAKATDNRGASSISEPVHIRVIDPPMPVVTIEATDPFATEGPTILVTTLPAGGVNTDPPANLFDTATFTVKRTGGTNTDLTVYYRMSGTASNGVDYHELSGQVTLRRGAWSARIVVLPTDDLLAEHTETIVVRLEPVACIAVFPPPPDCYLVGEPDQATAYLRDNDANLSAKTEIVEPRDGSVFVAPADIQIDVVTVDPDGYVSKVQFFADNRLIGEQEMIFIIALPPGQPQTFSMTWSNAPLGAHVLTARATDDRGAVSVSDPVHVAVVLNPPLPVVTIEATVPTTQEQDPRLMAPLRPAIFTVTRRGGDLTQTLKVFYRASGTASNGVDFDKLSGETEIPANALTSMLFVTAIDDALVEGTETVILALEQLRCVTTNTVPADGCYIVGTPGRAVAYLHDNDTPPNQPPKVALLSPANGATFVAPADIRLAASAEDPDGWVSTVEFFEGTNSLGLVTNFPWIVELARLPDLNGAVLSGLGTTPLPIPPVFRLWWSNAPAGQYVLTAVATDNEGGSRRSVPIEISVRPENQSPVVTIMAIDSVAREGTTNTAAFRVRRVGPTNEPLTVAYSVRGSASNGVDYVTLPGAVTIPAGRRTVRIVVTPLNDNLPETAETVIAQLQPSPLDVFPPPYVVGRPDTAAVLILDNDTPRPVTVNLPDGNLHVRLPMLNGLPYRLEASSDLRNWEPVMSGVTVTEDGIDFVEGEKKLLPRRFYRVVPELEMEEEE
ncbi:MAG: hypothetical protein HZA90_21845 [Verrucomicrobia bacterium]|nr:hypothetical protein [Verrucomicrobiota bacterium]